jgi:putative DNA primase/helicase
MASLDESSNADLIAVFVDGMRAAGLDPAESIISDGKLHRLRWRNDQNGTRNGFYALQLDSHRPAGAFGCWKRGVEQTWTADGDPEERWEH